MTVDRCHRQRRGAPRAVACALAGTMLVVCGCSKEIVVETTFPEPVISALELDAGVHYSDALTQYDYSEDLPNDIEWSFTLGEANTLMFESALGALFTNLVTVEEPGGTGEPYDSLDVVIQPTVEAFEFSLPRQSRSDQYAVWIRYNLGVFEPDGQFITNWKVSAYGQADSRLLRGSGAMEEAVVRAMRDAIANIVIGLPEAPAIKAAMFPDAPPPAAGAAEELAAEPLPTDVAPQETPPDSEVPPTQEIEEEATAEKARS
ncbi:MAG: hypothetical protein ACR2QV_12090 [Gammaproteobacteria bacterium]